MLRGALVAADRRTSGDTSVEIRIPFELQLRGDFAGGNCRTEQEALTLLAPKATQELELFLRFDALGKRHQAEAAANIDDRPEYFCGLPCCFDILDEDWSILILSNGKLPRYPKPQ